MKKRRRRKLKMEIVRKQIKAIEEKEKWCIVCDNLASVCTCHENNKMHIMI